MRSAILAVCVTACLAYLNVKGQPLQKRSTPGMALPGFTRDGDCVETVDDAGSHHICIDLSSTAGGNFCTVTGQPNWCGSNMQCMSSGGQCPVKHWCVCQWAFASYIQRAGGCSKIQDIDCTATNMEALKAYTSQAKSDSHIAAALATMTPRQRASAAIAHARAATAALVPLAWQ